MSTRKLAKELGLLRQRSQRSAGSKKPALSNQIFSYLIVIDFESTCWGEKNNYSQEIIEFPAVLLNTSTGEIESEFHTYVQPQEHPTLSKFCTELTGITQTQVEAGVPLHICLSRFGRWLQNLQLEMGVGFPNRPQRCSSTSPSQKLCTFITWSDWDLGVCLQYECKRKQLHKPEVLNSWIDLRSTYRLFYSRKPKGLNGALQDLGIQFSGREHSGLDDSRNTAKLAARMMRDGCVMKITRSLERNRSAVKPMFGNTTVEDKPNTNKEESRVTTNKPLSSEIPIKHAQIKSCSIRNLETKESSVQESAQICQSLISPKTLLNGTAAPLWGHGSRSLVKAEAATYRSTSVMNCISPHSNSSSLVLCSTTVGCLSTEPPPDQLSETRAKVGGEKPSEETEERCGSYDDVVLEGDDVLNDAGDERIPGFDSGCYVWEEPDNPYSTTDLFTLRDKCKENASTTEMMTSELSTTSLPIKMWSCANLSDQSNRMKNSADSYFAAPMTDALGSRENHHKTGLKTFLSVGKNSKTNASSPFGSKTFVPGNTSTPHTSFARPKPVIPQHAKQRKCSKSSFTIYTDPAKQAASHPSSSSCLYTPKIVLSSLSTNTLHSSNNRSSVPVKLKEGGKITSPLCACGRRAKRQVVSNGGPNHGRGFYCCPVRRSGSGGRIQKGCEFFKWESSLMKSSTVASPAVRSSVSLCQINPTLRCRPPQSSALRKSC